MTSEEKVELIVRIADDRQARDMILLDLRGLTVMTDYFFICSGNSPIHIRTIVDRIREAMNHAGVGGIRIEGYDAAQWVLMDYGDVVVHVMNPEQREYYKLEEFWQDAPHVPIDQYVAKPAATTN